MKRSIFVPYIAAFGGVERLILSLSKWLHAQSMGHEVVCFEDSIGLEKHVSWPVEVTQLKTARKILSEAAALRAFGRNSKWARGNPPLLFDLKGAFYATLAGLRDYTLHLTDPPSLLPVETSRASSSFRRWSGIGERPPFRSCLRGEVVHRLNRTGARRARTLIVMTERIRDELASLYAVKGTIIRPGIARSTPSNSKLRSVTDGPFRVLSVSRIEESKRLDAAIRAIAALSKTGEWELGLVGSGPATSALQELASESGVSGRIRMPGRVSDEELEHHFDAADVFVMPAVQGYGLPALEALERGLPVVMHAESGVAEVLRDNPWVIVVDHCDQLAEALGRMRESVESGSLAKASPPPILYEDEWARQIATACSWR